MIKKSNIFLLLGYLYIVLPIVLFLIGWCNIPTAIIGCIIITISSFFILKNSGEIWFPENKKQWITLAIALLISFIWVYSSGIGALVFQNLDHNCRNPIFELLVLEDWPVINKDYGIILTYYIGFWLPAAIIGKIFGSIQIGYYAQVLWGTIGIFLVFYYILASLNKKTILPIIIFIFFSGLDALGCFFGGASRVVNTLLVVPHLEWWAPGYQFSGMTTVLYWVFNQGIPAWIITMLLLHQKNNKNIIFIYSCMFLNSTLPAIGILPFIAYLGFKNGEDDNKILNKTNLLNAIKSGLTFQNIIGGLFITTVTYLYLSNNISGGKFWIPSIFQINIKTYIIFILIEVLLYISIIWKYNKNNILLYISLFCFITYPFIYIGHSNDFCMRATLPAVLILYLSIIKTLENTEFIKNKKALITIIIFLLIGSLTPICEMTRTIVFTSHGVTKVKPNLSLENFFGYIENNKFIKYFGRNN